MASNKENQLEDNDENKFPKVNISDSESRALEIEKDILPIKKIISLIND